jgi:excisionase family DNA binding protein
MSADVAELDPEFVTRPILPLTVRVREACRLTGIGRSKMYELISAGHIQVIKVGTITLIPIRSLERFLDLCSSEGPATLRRPMV